MKDRISRRHVLTILGITGVGAGGYYVFEEGFLVPEELIDRETETEAPTESAYQALQQEVNQLEKKSPEPEPRVQFEYGSIEVEKVENAPFSAVSAETNELQTGDQIEFRVGDVSGERLATMLRTMWRVESDLKISITITSDTIQFVGGEHEEYTALLAVDQESTPSRVLVARGETTNDAREMIQEFG